MKRKAGEEPIYARRSFGNVLPVSPADYDTSPRFGTSTPHYTIKNKYSQKVEIDEKDFPGHLEPNDMPRSPAYTISPRYKEAARNQGVGYNYIPEKFGSSGLKKTIGHRIEQSHTKSYSSPDKYNTREKFGQATPRYSISPRLNDDKYNGNSSWMGLKGVDSPGPVYDSSIQPETYFARSPRFTIGEKPSQKVRTSNQGKGGKLPSEYYDPPRETQMGNGSPKTQIRGRTDEISSWMTRGKEQVPGPGAYKTENSDEIFFSKKIEIKKRFPEKKIKNPSAEYILLPELSRGRQCSIGRKETMDLVY